MIARIDSHKPCFPPVDQALDEPDGLLCAGGNLAVDTLLKAYRRGIFPWYGNNEPILWWSPGLRMVLTPESLHLSGRMKRSMRASRCEISFNTDFAAVIGACAQVARRDQSGTWIVDEMQEAYCQLHGHGYAHSVEVREQGELVGGLYGVAYGKVFFGESMFSLVANASKMALAALVATAQFDLIDCQVTSRHLASLGAFELPRSQFVQRLAELAQFHSPPSWPAWGELSGSVDAPWAGASQRI